jgi:hypothetical protein
VDYVRVERRERRRIDADQPAVDVELVFDNTVPLRKTVR